MLTCCSCTGAPVTHTVVYFSALLGPVFQGKRTLCLPGAAKFFLTAGRPLHENRYVKIQTIALPSFITCVIMLVFDGVGLCYFFSVLVDFVLFTLLIV